MSNTTPAGEREALRRRDSAPFPPAPEAEYLAAARHLIGQEYDELVSRKEESDTPNNVRGTSVWLDLPTLRVLRDALAPAPAPAEGANVGDLSFDYESLPRLQPKLRDCRDGAPAEGAREREIREALESAIDTLKEIEEPSFSGFGGAEYIAELRAALTHAPKARERLRVDIESVGGCIDHCGKPSEREAWVRIRDALTLTTEVENG